MKKQVITIMAVVILFATLCVASIQAQDSGTMLVTIPFDFVVSNQTLPAGEYYVRRSVQGPRVLTQISARHKTAGAYLSTRPIEDREIQEKSKLVFNKYGDQYFLSQVWTAGYRTGQELGRTNQERARQRDFARQAVKRETISIAGRLK
jgi:hypothetical protein